MCTPWSTLERALPHPAPGSAVSCGLTFNPAQTALLLIGGDKTGNSRWYETNIPKAEAIYAAHLEELKRGI